MTTGMGGCAIHYSTIRLSKCVLFFFSFQWFVREIKVWQFTQKPKVTNIHSFTKIVCHKLLPSLTRRPYCVVSVSTSQYCDNSVRLWGVSGGLAIRKVDSLGIFDVFVDVCLWMYLYTYLNIITVMVVIHIPSIPCTTLEARVLTITKSQTISIQMGISQISQMVIIEAEFCKPLNIRMV